MPRFMPIKHVRTYTEIVEQISAMIRNQELMPGDRLPSERVLSQEVGTGRQCLREALSVLEVLGLIEVKKGRGTFIRADALQNLAANSFDAEQFDSPFELMEARKVVEAKTAALAAKRADAQDIVEMEQILQEMDARLACGEHPGEEDKRLHMLIARASRNQVLYKLMSVVIENMGKRLWRKVKERSLLVAGRNIRYNEEHKKLVAAIKSGDARDAETIILHHLSGIEKDLRA